MSDLLDVSSVRVPHELAEAAREHLRAAGEHGLEGMVLWAGAQSGETFDVQATLVPRQTAKRTASGLLVMVDEEELFRLNVWLYENGLRLVAQLHSHPGRAYHSETDDAFPIMAKLGGYSLVLPDFAIRPFDLGDLAAYRLQPGPVWSPLSREEIFRTFDIWS